MAGSFRFAHFSIPTFIEVLPGGCVHRHYLNPSETLSHNRSLTDEEPQAGKPVTEFPTPVNWRKVTDGMSKGDPTSFATFHDKFFIIMLREAHRLLGPDESSCLDVVQESMVSMIKSIKPMESELQLIRWVRVVVRNKSLDLLRRQQRRREVFAACGAVAAVTQASELEAQKRARMIWIEEQLKETPREIQKLLSLRFRLGWTLQQIGEHLGLKTGAVDGRIQRAVEQLRSQARRQYDEP